MCPAQVRPCVFAQSRVPTTRQIAMSTQRKHPPLAPWFSVCLLVLLLAWSEAMMSRAEQSSCSHEMTSVNIKKPSCFSRHAKHWGSLYLQIWPWVLAPQAAAGLGSRGCLECCPPQSTRLQHSLDEALVVLCTAHAHTGISH